MAMNCFGVNFNSMFSVASAINMCAVQHLDGRTHHRGNMLTMTKGLTSSGLYVSEFLSILHSI